VSSKVAGRLDGIHDFDVLVVDVQARDHRVGDDTGAEHPGGVAPDLPDEDQRDRS
jgi:hypothetical protein